MEPLAWVTGMFYAGAALMGISGLGLVVFFGWMAVSYRVLGRGRDAAGRPLHPESLVVVVEAIGRAIGAFAKLFAFLGHLLAIVLTALGVVLIGFAVLWFCVARGLATGEPWARPAGGLALTGLLLFAALLGLASPARWITAFALVCAGACLSALWTLWQVYPGAA